MSDESATVMEVRASRVDVAELAHKVDWMSAMLELLCGRSVYTIDQIAAATMRTVDDVRDQARRLKIRIRNGGPGAGRGNTAHVLAADARRLVDRLAEPDEAAAARRRLVAIDAELAAMDCDDNRKNLEGARTDTGGANDACSRRRSARRGSSTEPTATVHPSAHV